MAASPSRLRPSGLIVVACAAIALVSMTLSTVGPLLPHFKAAMHSSLYAALVVAGHPIGALLAAIPTLVASRRFGLPRVIVAGGLLMSASSILFVWPGSGWWIVLARIGFGFSAAAVWQSVFAWTITNTGLERRARTIGILTGASTAGSLVGPQLGALAAHVGVWLCAAPPLALLFAATRFRGLPHFELLERPDLARVRAALSARDGLGGASLTSLGAVIGLGTTVTVPLALSGRGVGAFGIGAVLTCAYAALVLGNPLAGRIADRGRTRTLVVAMLGLLTLVYLGIEMTGSASVALPLSFAAFCLTGMPALAGNVLLSRAVSQASLDQTVSQTLATLAWAPAAIVGSVSAGVVSSPDAALIVLAVIAGSAAGIAALERAQRRRPQMA
ncbi:MAG: MFS transporter [Gaiellaceae bacterium]